jgi:hypothetical protein
LHKIIIEENYQKKRKKKKERTKKIRIIKKNSSNAKLTEEIGVSKPYKYRRKKKVAPYTLLRTKVIQP